MKKKWLVVLGAVVALPLLAVVAVLLFADPKGFVEKKKDEAAAAASDVLGRELSVGAIDASFVPFGATVRDLRLAGPDPKGPATLAVASIEVRLSLWRALLTLGREITVSSVEVRDLELRVARDASGRWDFQDVLDRLEANAPPPSVEQPERAGSPLEGVQVRRLALRNASIHVDDAALGRPLAVERTDLVVDGLRLGRPLTGTLDTVLVDGAQRTDVHARIDLAELPADLAFDPMPDVEVAVKTGSLALSPWGGLLPAEQLAPAGGTVSADLRLAARKNLAVIEAKGRLTLAGVVLREAGRKGRPLDLTAVVDASLDGTAPRYRVAALSLDGTGLKAFGRLDARGLSPAALSTASLDLTVADLGRLLAVLPASGRILPAELSLEGPLSARVAADGAKVEVGADLGGARVSWAEVFDKPKGRPLRLALAGTRKGDLLEVPAFALVVDRATLGGSLRLPAAAGAPFSADVKTGKVELASLKDVVPPFAAALARGNRVAGTVEASLSASDAAGKQKARAELVLAGLDVKLATAEARGGGTVLAEVTPSGESVTLLAKADFDGLALRSTDGTGATVLDKPAGMPLAFDLEVVSSPSRAEVKRASARIGTTSVAGKGAATGLDGHRPELDVDLGTVDIAFDDLRRALPGAATLPAGGRLGAAIRFGGSPESLSTVKVSLDAIALNAGRTRLTGTASVEDLDHPRFAFDVKGDALDVDGLLGIGGERDAAAPAEKPENPHGLPSGARALLARTSGKGSIRAKTAYVKGFTLTDFAGTLTMKNGVTAFEALDFGLYGGKVSAAGSAFDLPAERLGYRLKLDVKNVDLGAALADRTRLGRALGGRTSHALDLTGRGIAAADLVSLHGPVSLRTSDLALAPLDLPGAIFGALQKEDKAGVLGSAAASGEKGAPKGGTSLKDVDASMRLEGGKIRLMKPLETKTGWGALSAEGHAFLDSRLDYRAVASLSPETIARWTGGKVRPATSLPVPLKIGGTWDRPAVTGIDAKKLAAALALDAFASGATPGTGGTSLAEVEADARKKRAEAEAQAKAATADAQAQAKAEAERGKKAAEEAKKKAEEDARRKAEAAKKKAEEEARRKAEEARKKLFGD